jgi:cleavage stimulation factor subunit 2
MNLVDYSTLGAVVEQATQPTAAAAPSAPPAAQAFQPFSAVPGQISTPPMVNTPFAQPAAQAAPQQQVPSQEELLQQVLSMPQSAIDALPPMERNQIMLLRQQLMQGAMR